MSTLFAFECQNSIFSSQSHSEADHQDRLQDHDYVKTFLQWLSFSVRPLTLEELATTAAIDLSAENGPEYKSDNELQDVEDVLKLCSSFITKSKGVV